MAELAGLVVGIVPLVVGIIKQYSTLRTVCSRIVRQKEGVDELRRFLRRQQTIFNNETRLLLVAAVGSVEASLMCKDPKYAAWTDEKTIKRIEDVLGELRDDLKEASIEVLDNMRALASEVGRQGNLRSKIQFGISKSKISGICTAIRESTEDYRTIRQQIHELANTKPVVDRQCVTKRDSITTINIQAAAEHVYRALTTACNLHSVHHAHMSLRPKCSSIGPMTKVVFQMAYRHLPRQQVRSGTDVHWFMIESVIDDEAILMQPAITKSAPISAKQPMSEQAPKRSWSISRDAVPCATSSRSKRVRFRSPSSTGTISATNEASTSQPPSLSARCLTADLCRQLMTAYQNNCSSDLCIGWLENSPPWRHGIYPNCRPSSEPAASMPSDTRVLKELLISNAMSLASLPLERLRVAKVLAEAILNYHSTSWMRDSWRSSNIMVYIEENNQPFSFSKSEPKVFVETPVDDDPQRAAIARAQSFDIPLVRNSALFSLGVMMLELAMGKPLEAMLKPCDSKNSAISPAERDWHAALRLSKEVGAGFGLKYSRLVEQCLLCAFGQGTDLANSSLQDAVHRDIIEELDRLIEGFSQISIAALT